MKSNFKKSKRWSPKNNNKRNLKREIADKDKEPLKPKKLNIEKILEIQKKLKEKEDTKKNK